MNTFLTQKRLSAFPFAFALVLNYIISLMTNTKNEVCSFKLFFRVSSFSSFRVRSQLLSRY